MTRVQIPSYHDRFMMGDRFGEVLRQYDITVDGEIHTRAKVKLDKSNRISVFISSWEASEG